jgi:hypothetical protein
MIHSSLFGPVREVPPINCSDFILYPPGVSHPPDQLLYIDAIAEKQSTRGEFINRVNALCREFCTPTSEGGMGLAEYKDVMVGIYSDNSLVRQLIFSDYLRYRGLLN